MFLVILLRADGTVERLEAGSVKDAELQMTERMERCDDAEQVLYRAGVVWFEDGTLVDGFYKSGLINDSEFVHERQASVPLSFLLHAEGDGITLDLSYEVGDDAWQAWATLRGDNRFRSGNMSTAGGKMLAVFNEVAYGAEPEEGDGK